MPSLAIARSQYAPGALKVACVGSCAEVPPARISVLSGSKNTRPPLAGARYRIHRIRRPICARGGGAAPGGKGWRIAEGLLATAFRLRLRGVGIPSSVADAASFSGLPASIVVSPFTLMRGAV